MQFFFLRYRLFSQRLEHQDLSPTIKVLQWFSRHHERNMTPSLLTSKRLTKVLVVQCWEIFTSLQEQEDFYFMGIFLVLRWRKDQRGTRIYPSIYFTSRNDLVAMFFRDFWWCLHGCYNLCLVCPSNSGAVPVGYVLFHAIIWTHHLSAPEYGLQQGSFASSGFPTRQKP